MRFKIEQSKNKPNHWVCSDFENKIVCIFEDGRYNDTQRFEVLDDTATLSANELARAVREMADWLRDNHYDKVVINIREKLGKNLKSIRTEKG